MISTKYSIILSSLKLNLKENMILTSLPQKMSNQNIVQYVYVFWTKGSAPSKSIRYSQAQFTGYPIPFTSISAVNLRPIQFVPFGTGIFTCLIFPDSGYPRSQLPPSLNVLFWAVISGTVYGLSLFDLRFLRSG